MITHHPSEESLLQLALGTAPLGPGLVLRAHLEVCPVCQARVQAFEVLGGTFLQDETPVALRPGGKARVFACLDETPVAAPRPVKARRRPKLPDDMKLPECLEDYDLGPWQIMGPGISYSEVKLPKRPGARTFLMRSAPGVEIPFHGHHNNELTLVLKGAFCEDADRFGPGDISQAHAEIDHKPVIDPQSECIAFVAMEGRYRFHDWVARLMQPILGF